MDAFTATRTLEKIVQGHYLLPLPFPLGKSCTLTGNCSIWLRQLFILCTSASSGPFSVGSKRPRGSCPGIWITYNKQWVTLIPPVTTIYISPINVTNTFSAKGKGGTTLALLKNLLALLSLSLYNLYSYWNWQCIKSCNISVSTVWN